MIRKFIKPCGVFAQNQSKLSKAFLSISVSPRNLVLGIETSCDDTGLALVDSTGHVLWEALSSQWDQVFRENPLILQTHIVHIQSINTTRILFDPDPGAHDTFACRSVLIRPSCTDEHFSHVTIYFQDIMLTIDFA